MFVRLTTNLTNAPIRHETLQGKQYLVAPLAMITEGVHSGSGGPLLYKESEIKRAVPAWNMKPIVVYHPEQDGKGISAADPVVLEKQQVGMLLNVRYSAGKLRAEAWIDELQANKVDSRVIEALENNKIMEVSTGLFTENVGSGGKWGDKDYVAEATNHQPDHLALLPDQIGACSVADGAGLLQINEAATAAGKDVTRLLAREMDVLRKLVGNAMSNSKLHEALGMALREKLGNNKTTPCYGWVVDVYPKFFIYEEESPNGMKLYKLGYTANKDGVTIDNDTPEEVVRVVEYRTADTGKFVGNEARTTKERNMDRKKVIDGLIANEATGFEESDRAVLEKLDDAALQLHAKAAMPKKKKMPMADLDEDMADGAAGNDDDADGSGEYPAVKKPTKNAKAKQAANAKPATVQEYVNAAPPEIRDMLTNGLAVADAEKAKCIETIVANKGNKFTKEFLATKGLAELQGMAALCAPPTANSAAPAMFFGGQATPVGQQQTNNATVTEGPLEMPVLNFERKK